MSADEAARPVPPQQDLALPPFTGRIAPAFDRPALRAALAALAPPGAEARVVSRSADVVTRVPLAGVDAAVKTFAARGALRGAADHRRGSAARRSWQHALALQARGIGTPAPIAFLERHEGGRLAESHYVSAFADGVTSFRDELIHLFRRDPACWKLMNLLQAVADAVRALHDAGIRHGDLGNQNILLRRDGDGQWRDVQFVDLNRVRTQGEPLGLRDRAFDVSRLFLPSDLLRVFKEMYFGRPPPPLFDAEEARLRRRFAWHTRTRRWRHPIRERRRAREAAAAEGYPPPRDVWIWDDRSAQPVNVYRARERNRLTPWRQHAQVAASALASVAPAWRAYRTLLAGAFAAPVALRHRAGVGIAPHPDTWAQERALLRELGPLPVFARFHHHEAPDRWAFTAAALRELHAAGYPVSIALVQDRRAVREPAAWRAFADRVLELSGDVAEWIQIGQAINRVKWGLWSPDDYPQLVQGVREAAAGRAGLRFMGPAVIDFEYHHVAAALRRMPGDFRFGALAHLLYVDRRGAPENRQGRFSALEKFALARAIAQASRACEDRLIVTEFNWPLKDGGVYSPVGSPYLYPGQVLDAPPSASEEEAAHYLIRYLLLALCSGLCERVFWWRLAARGYGLVDDADPAAWRPRPAFFALQHWLREAAPATFTGRTGDGAYAFARPDGTPLRIDLAGGAPRFG